MNLRSDYANKDVLLKYRVDAIGPVVSRSIYRTLTHTTKGQTIPRNCPVDIALRSISSDTVTVCAFKENDVTRSPNTGDISFAVS